MRGDPNRRRLRDAALAAFIAISWTLPQAQAHPIDDMCAMDRWACMRARTAQENAARVSGSGQDGPASTEERAALPDVPEQELAVPIERTTRPRSPIATVSVEPATPMPEAERSNQPEPRTLDTSAERPLVQTIGLYLQLGFLHILPKGLDHILFVLALFLASTRVRSLLIQITTFTVAHTITLALAASGLVNAPANIVEPLIALSIAFVAVENVVFKDMTHWRPLIIFGFGLFHGLGFAGVLAELGLPRGQFAPALVSFNIGVELGQLTVVALALVPALLLRRLLRRENAERLYRPIAVIPASCVIAIIGAWWAFERMFLGG